MELRRGRAWFYDLHLISARVLQANEKDPIRRRRRRGFKHKREGFRKFGIRLSVARALTYLVNFITKLKAREFYRRLKVDSSVSNKKLCEIQYE